MKKFFKKHLVETVAILIYFATSVTVAMLTNAWIAVVIGFIASQVITYFLLKACAKDAVKIKIIKKGLVFCFYYLMATQHNLLNEEQEILLVSFVNERSETHIKMFEYYTECRPLSSKAKEMLKSN